MTLRIVGVWVIVVGLAAAVVFTVIPANIEILGSTASCGIPIVSVESSGTLIPASSDQAQSDGQQECAQESGERLIAAAVFALGGVIGGGVVGVMGQREEDWERRNRQA